MSWVASMAALCLAAAASSPAPRREPVPSFLPEIQLVRFQNGTGCAGLSFSLSRNLLVAGGDGGGVLLVFVFFIPADPTAVDAPFLFAAAAAAALPSSSASLVPFPLAAGAPDDISALVVKGCPVPRAAEEAAANGSDAAFFANAASSRCDSLAACGAAGCKVAVMRTWKAGKVTPRGGSRRNLGRPQVNVIHFQASKLGESQSHSLVLRHEKHTRLL